MGEGCLNKVKTLGYWHEEMAWTEKGCNMDAREGLRSTELVIWEQGNR